MTARQKKFILEKLIPFILRDQGRGFEMYVWGLANLRGEYYHPDLGKHIPAPKCGTACCIGGSIDLLKRVTTKEEINSYGNFYGNFTSTAKLIGLDRRQAHNLFVVSRWPEPYCSRYSKSQTPIAQAKVAAALLKKVVETNGEILDGY